MRKKIGLALMTMALLAAASCSCGNSIGQAKVGSVTGAVIKGPVAAATVTAFALDGARKGDEVGKGTTAEDGTFTFEVGSHSGAMLVCATRGTYVEESTGGLVQLGTNELCGLVSAHEAGATSTVLVTPLTSLHAALTGCFLDASRDATLGAAEQHAALRLNDFFAAGQVGFDLRTTVPLDVTAGLAASLTNEAWSGILIAGISESAKSYAVASGLDPGVRVTAATLTSALTQDIDDGACIFDGQTSTARLVQGSIELDENTLRGSPQGLATSILRFLEGDRNLSGIAQDNVRDLVQRMQGHTSEIFGGGGGGADIDSPTVSFSEPTAGSTRGGSIRVTARAVDASRIVEFAFTAPDQAAFVASTFTCTDDTATDCTVTGTLNTNLAPVVDGPLDILARAVDAAGNPTPQTLSIVVNNTLPSIQVATPQDAQPVEGVFVINATASDAEGIASLTVEIPGVGLCDDQPTSPCRDIQPANGTLQVAWDTTTLPEGNVTLVFRAVDAAGQEAEQEVTVLVDNSDIGAITGFVDLGTPVFGATVTALVWTGRVRGGVLGTATTSATGEFRVDLDDAEHASVLMVVTGGSYVDLATGVTFTVADGQELTSAVGAIAPGDVRPANVNAWTTLAAARAKSTPAGGLEVDAINLNNALLSQHLRRVPFGMPFSVATTKSADLTSEVVRIDDQRAVLALSHAGLSRLASELSVAQVDNIGAINMAGLITVLAADLQADPSLNGIGATDVLTIGPDLEPITSLTTRFDLVAALDRYLKAVPLIGADVNRNVSGITADDAFQGRLYEAMAEDNRFELYPEPGRPFDTTPPVITLEFAGTNRDAQPGDPLRDTVQINGTALDDSAIATFGGTLTIDGTFIPDDDSDTNKLRVFIATDVVPNASDAAGACPNASDAADVAVLEDSVCLCAIAEDVQSNVGEGILCFTRPLPAPSITFPPPGRVTVINATASIPLAGSATSGFDVETCTATLTHATAQAPTLTTPVPSGPSCSFAQTLGAGSLADGAWTLAMNVGDIAGRAGTASRDFIVDTTPPTVTITPQPVTNLRTITIGGTVGGGDLQDVTVAFLGNTTVIPLAPNAITWSSNVVLEFLVGGDVPVTVTARDLNQNTRQLTQVFSFDFDAPTLAIQANQPAIVDYGPAQPVAAVGLLPCLFGTCIDKRRMDVTAAAARIPHVSVFLVTGTPTVSIVRWDSMLDSSVNAPRVILTASDDRPDVKVHFAISTTCAATASRIATSLGGGEFAIDFLQANSSVNLGPQTGAATLCLVIEAIDAAGNPSSRITRNFKWQTISTPPTVTMNPSFLDTAGRTYPNGVPDAGTFQGTNLSQWLRGGVAQYGVLHGYMHNPTTQALQAAVNFAGGSTMALKVDVRQREMWTSSAIPTVPESGIGTGNGGSMRNICHITSGNGEVTPSIPRPLYDLTLSCLVQPGLPSNTSGAVYDVTAWTGNANVVTAAAIRSRNNVASRPTNFRDVSSTFTHPQPINLNTNLLYFTVNAANGTPVVATNTDANGMVTIPAGSSILWVVTGANTDAFPNIEFYLPNRGAVDPEATPLFLSTPGLNPTLPAISVTNTVFVKRTNVTAIPPKVLIWGHTVSATDPNKTCTSGNCAIGLNWTQADRMRAEPSSAAQRMVLTTRRNSQTQSWATTTAFPATARRVDAPVSPVIP